ncbi:MAG: PKD domain-containing protein, partial [Bacteroidetes bacterium]|nr:PKD domain-containing protein [Bacteroidota bacterium]
GDKVCDTPPHKQNDCGVTNPCISTGIWDNSRRNYMSYCSLTRMFTQNQKDKMRAIAILAPRESLLSSQGCVGQAAPVSDLSVTSICAGLTIYFQDISANCPNIWSWSFPGGTPSSSMEKNPIVTYNASGRYSVSLTPSNTAGSGDKITKEIVIYRIL